MAPASWRRLAAAGSDRSRGVRRSRSTRSGCRSACPRRFRRFPYQRVRDFYRQNYTPDRIAVVIVGDLDALRPSSSFASTSASSPRGNRRSGRSIPSRRTRTRASRSPPIPEAQASSVSVLPHATAAEDPRRWRLSPQISSAACSNRCSTRGSARSPGVPMRHFSARPPATTRLGRTVEAFGVSARVNDGGIAKGVDALEQELARVRQFGFGDAELDRVKKSTLASYDRAYNERDKSENPGFASELVALFLNDVAGAGHRERNTRSRSGSFRPSRRQRPRRSRASW